MTLGAKVYFTAVVLHAPAFAVCAEIYGPHGLTGWVLGSWGGLLLGGVLFKIWSD